MADDLRDRIAEAITYHPGNRTGTPEQRHPVSLTLADAVMREAVGPELERLRTELAEARAALERLRGNGLNASKAHHTTKQQVTALKENLNARMLKLNRAEAERDALRGYQLRALRAEAAIERVRAAHPRVDDGLGAECRGCGNPVAGIVSWPCSTIAALDTPTPTEETP